MRRSRRAYSLISTDFGKLKHILNLLTPGLVFACDGDVFARAIEAAVPPDVEVVVTRNPLAAPADDAVRRTRRARRRPRGRRRARRASAPDTIAKFLFTSGSTGMPKGVINTQRMWCSNQAMMRTVARRSSRTSRR